MRRLRELLGEAEFQKKLHLWLMYFWAVQLPIVCLMYFYLPDAWQAVSILYLAIVSIYANFVGHFGSWQAAKTEVKQAETATEVVDLMVEKTTVEKVADETVQEVLGDEASH